MKLVRRCVTQTASSSKAAQCSYSKGLSGAISCPACRVAIRTHSLASFRPPHDQSSRRYATLATASITPPDSLDISLSPPPSVPLPLPVEGTSSIAPVLKEVRRLLDDEIGGSEHWSRRVSTAILDLDLRRRGRIGGMFPRPAGC